MMAPPREAANVTPDARLAHRCERDRSDHEHFRVLSVAVVGSVQEWTLAFVEGREGVDVERRDECVYGPTRVPPGAQAALPAQPDLTAIRLGLLHQANWGAVYITGVLGHSLGVGGLGAPPRPT